MLREHADHGMWTQHVFLHAVEQRTEKVDGDKNENNLESNEECNVYVLDQVDVPYNTLLSLNV